LINSPFRYIRLTGAGVKLLNGDPTTSISAAFVWHDDFETTE
jgi:hypothetical protein